MRYPDAYVPLGAAWSSPFARWQGPLANMSSLDLAADVTGRALERCGVAPEDVDDLVLGWTVPQEAGFYGAPTLAARLGATQVTGPMLAQACATSAATVSLAALTTSVDPDRLVLVVLTDRTSNGPHIVYPNPSSQGGTVRSEDWVLDNFRRDPWAGEAMITTAEAVAAEAGISRGEVDEVAALRYTQYERALADDRAFQRRYLVPVQVPARRGPPTVVETDHGIRPTTLDDLKALEPVEPDGIVTFGTQTHPADGTAGLVVTGRSRARALGDGGVARILSSGRARVARARMPSAPVPAAREALRDAGVEVTDLAAVVTHNPFAVNDCYLSRELGLPTEAMNTYGSSLVYGHPQGPTGARLLAELIETLRLRGGGIGLFTGCAAGDTGMAVVVMVDDA